MELRNYKPGDIDRILELNEESVHFLSPLTKEKLKRLIGQSEMLSVIEVDGRVEAFVLTITEGKDYDSVNYQWFSKNYEKFLYIDRVVVSVEMHGKGLGRKLYEKVFEYAKEIDAPIVAAEIDINPPNPGSLNFHKKSGFKEVGKQSVAGGKKEVSLQVLEL